MKFRETETIELKKSTSELKEVTSGKKVKSAGRLVEGLVEGLVENQKRILNLMKRSPNISKKKLAEKIGISSTAIDKNINQLKKKGLLRRIGPDKGGQWFVIESKE